MDLNNFFHIYNQTKKKQKKTNLFLQYNKASLNLHVTTSIKLLW